MHQRAGSGIRPLLLLKSRDGAGAQTFAQTRRAPGSGLHGRAAQALGCRTGPAPEEETEAQRVKQPAGALSSGETLAVGSSEARPPPSESGRRPASVPTGLRAGLRRASPSGLFHWCAWQGRGGCPRRQGEPGAPSPAWAASPRCPGSAIPTSACKSPGARQAGGRGLCPEPLLPTWSLPQGRRPAVPRPPRPGSQGRVQSRPMCPLCLVSPAGRGQDRARPRWGWELS